MLKHKQYFMKKQLPKNDQTFKRRRNVLMKCSWKHLFCDSSIRLDRSREDRCSKQRNKFTKSSDHNIIEISTNTTNEKDLWEKEFKSNRQFDVNCDDFCEQIDQFESVKCENHDYSDFSNQVISMRSRSDAKIMFYEKSSIEANISCSNEFKNKKRKANISCSSEFQIKKK